MQRLNLSPSLEISRIIYGMWRLDSDQNKSTNHINNKINLCLNQGITTFDQAAVYGGYSSEALFGKVIKSNSSFDISFTISEITKSIFGFILFKIFDSVEIEMFFVLINTIKFLVL